MAAGTPEPGKAVAPSAPPKWRQTFDAIEREVTPRLDTVIRSEQFAVATGLAAQVQRRVAKQAARNTRRVLHMLNLPAGTDVTRLLNEIGQLKAQVRTLSSQIEAQIEAQSDAPSAPPARAASRKSAKEVTPDGPSPRPKRAPRTRQA